MANEYWGRVAGESGYSGTNIQFGTACIRHQIMAPTGAPSASEAKDIMEMTGGDVDEQYQEYEDLRDSIDSIPALSILGLNVTLLEQNRLNRINSCIDTIDAISAFQSSINAPYTTGDAFRLRVKSIVTQFGGTPVGSLAAS